ncbi:MAG: TIGR00645 family protein [Cellvibrionaceae bacterium]|nr:TIGR00645 family protein [Cellvibrionaceae bacterium]
MEKLIEQSLYRARWLLAPIYLGLAVALLALIIKFFQESVYLLLGVFHMSEAKMILSILTLIDLAMVGGLIVMVMMSGYENFVSQLDLDGEKEKLNWLGKMDSSSLKGKIAASIVAISSIHLLKVFMNVTNTEETHIYWYTVLHVTFVASAFAMGYLDLKLKHK